MRTLTPENRGEEQEAKYRYRFAGTWSWQTGASQGLRLLLRARMDEARAAWSATAALATLKGDHMVAKQADAAVKRLG